jgi:hypothetical protein
MSFRVPAAKAYSKLTFLLSDPVMDHGDVMTVQERVTVWMKGAMTGKISKQIHTQAYIYIYIY